MVFLLTLFSVVFPADATRPSTRPAEPAPRFAVVDVVVDSGDRKLAAYQFEFKTTAGDVTVTSLEGGDHAAFAKEPYYDPAALHKENRVIVGAFSTDADLPSGKTRVAQVHVMITGDVELVYEVKLTVAATADGTPIHATAQATPQGADQ